MFVAATLLAIAAFARWLRTESRSALWVGAVGAATASTIRYEGWVFNAAILLVGTACHLSTQKPGRKELLLWALALFAYPALWMATQFSTVSPVHTVISDARQFTTIEILRRNPFVEFVSTNAFLLNLIGLVAVFQVVRRDKWHQKAVLAASFFPLVIVSIGLLLIRSAQTAAPWRSSCVWTMLLIPFTARFVVGEERALREGRVAVALRVCAAALLMSAFLADTFRLQRDSGWAFPQCDRLAGKYLDGMISKVPNTLILVESSFYFYVALEVASQHPDSFVENSVPEHPGSPVLAPGDSLRSVVEARKIALFAFRTDEYKRFLDSSPEVVKLKEFGPWTIYRAAPLN